MYVEPAGSMLRVIRISALAFAALLLGWLTLVS
jgi:hypothetical protein